MGKSGNHYLCAKEQKTDVYKEEMERCLNTLSRYTTTKQLNKLKADLQLQCDAFNEPQYLQAACETSVTATIAEAFPDNFRYEPKLSPPSDVDCTFKSDGYHFNIEIKCPDYTKMHEQDARDVFNIGAFGKMNEFPIIASNLSELFADGVNKLEAQPHMDNKLKDFLLSAHKKFPSTTTEQELNILLVCCDDAMDMQKWFFYMFGLQGLLTPESYHSPEKYCNVDAIILSNIYNRHYNYSSKDKLSEHWDFNSAFNLIFKNRSISRGKDVAIWKLVDLVPNFSHEIMEHECSEIDQYLMIPHFVNSVLSGKHFA